MSDDTSNKQDAEGYTKEEANTESTASSATTCPASPGATETSAFLHLGGGKYDFDLIVIGSGPAAQGCAVSSSRRGKKVAVIDRPGMLGGVCVNTGTIPSKTFREAVLHLTGKCTYITSILAGDCHANPPYDE